MTVNRNSLTRLNLSKAKILMVEDNANGMEILAQILLGFGANMTTKCTSTAEARRALEQETFDLALIDDEMPGDTGRELISAIRCDPQGRNYTVATILLSSHASKTKVTQARDSGANFVVSKPITPAVLISRIEWIARETRQFIVSDNYRGPDRRFKSVPLKPDQPERRADALRLIAEPEKALSQDEISSLFD